MARGKLTKLEKYWILYDVANSAFILLVTTIVPIYFNSLARRQVFRKWIIWPIGAMPLRWRHWS